VVSGSFRLEYRMVFVEGRRLSLGLTMPPGIVPVLPSCLLAFDCSMRRLSTESAGFRSPPGAFALHTA